MICHDLLCSLWGCIRQWPLPENNSTKHEPCLKVAYCKTFRIRSSDSSHCPRYSYCWLLVYASTMSITITREREGCCLQATLLNWTSFFNMSRLPSWFEQRMTDSRVSGLDKWQLLQCVHNILYDFVLYFCMCMHLFLFCCTWSWANVKPALECSPKTCILLSWNQMCSGNSFLANDKCSKQPRL